MDIANAPLPPLAGSGPAPVRRPNSIRRTMSIDSWWPDGSDGAARFDGRFRDSATNKEGNSSILAHGTIKGAADLQRHILTLSSEGGAALTQLEGLRAGGELRAKLRELYPATHARASGHYLLLDDLAGATLVSSWAWFAWDGYSEALGHTVRGAGISGWNGSMRGLCIGLRDGSSALDARGFPKMEEQLSATVGSLIHPDDPEGWHQFPIVPGAAMRRARWLDVYRDDGQLVAEAGFQDSGARKDGGRQAIHEYRLRAAFDKTGRIVEISAIPNVLPHGDCPAAILNIGRLVGTHVDEIRDIVPARLAKEDGCTHLNDVARSLASVTDLAHHLPVLRRTG